MVERFFSTTNSPTTHDDPIILLSGPPPSGKTSLLFQFAFNFLVNDAHTSAVFICSRRTKAPFLSKGVDPSSNVFDRIQIKICQQRYHSPRGRELAIVRTLALCRNAIDHANETGTCMLLLSDTHHGDTPKFLHIYKRWVNSIYTVKGDGIGSFIIKSNGPEIVRTAAAKYSVALQYLVLEEMYENEEQRKIT
ncbi:uncharacterized protein LOC110921138 isoform X2 [Helianthus annuus]|uniref:uncharacterized protein LOC110921138 isoform X2 n=1 Tax=Helianthus annuus TaxID=4232 RepID=UPI000B904276|nr:uncharacterized protein LOC110921138 isoform X2 [Helianthus annuus]